MQSGRMYTYKIDPVGRRGFLARQRSYVTAALGFLEDEI